MKTDLHPEFMPWWTKAKEFYGKKMPSFVEQDGEKHELLTVFHEGIKLDSKDRTLQRNYG